MGKGYKVVVCGMASVGKTAILEQILYGNYIVGMECNATVEDVYVALAETDRGLKEQLRLYDTKGVEGVEHFPRHYFSIADGFVLVYAVNSLESFQKVDQLKNEIDKLRDKKEMSCIAFQEEKWDKNPKGDIGDAEFYRQWIERDVSVVVLGNKTDLVEQRQVTAEVAQQWAKLEKVKLWEVTVTDRRTLMEPFTMLASKLSQTQNKSTFPLPGRKSKGNNGDN